MGCEFCHRLWTRVSSAERASSSVRALSFGSTASKMTFVCVGPSTMRKSWMLSRGSMAFAASASSPRMCAVLVPSGLTGSICMTASQPSFDSSSYSAVSMASCSSKMSPSPGTSAWSETMSRPGP